jgi:hypothetical protein
MKGKSQSGRPHRSFVVSLLTERFSPLTPGTYDQADGNVATTGLGMHHENILGVEYPMPVGSADRRLDISKIFGRFDVLRPPSATG